MSPFKKLLKVVLVAVVYSPTSLAMPWPTHMKHETHRTHIVGRGNLALQVESFAPASKFEVRTLTLISEVTHLICLVQTYGTDGLDHPLAKRDNFDIQSAAKAFVSSKLNVTADNVHYNTGYSADVSHHAYIKQQAVRITF